MFAGGQICDLLGMRRLMALGFIGHVLGILLTACAAGFWTLYAGTLSIGMANGIVEAALNPLVATLYPERKTERLNALHVWFPGGIVLGGLMSLALTGLGWGWRGKTAFLFVPVLVYGWTQHSCHEVQSKESPDLPFGLPDVEEVAIAQPLPTGDLGNLGYHL